MVAATSRFEVVVIGAGFAGVATALSLARRGETRVLVVEAERGPGHHATGRNAAMFRRVVSDPLLAQVATESLEHLRSLEARHGVSLMRPVGGLLLGDPSDCHELLSSAGRVDGLRDEVIGLEGAELAERVPALRGATSRAAVWSPGCGVVDIHGLLSAMIDEARALGVQFEYRAEVREIGVVASRVASVGTSLGTHECSRIVNAGGHRAARIAQMAGAASVPLQPARRHLYVSDGARDVPPDAPYVWDVTQGFYFRPEGGGLLLCACDDTPWGDEAVVVDPDHRAALARVLLDHVPALGAVRPARGWAGLRTGTPDGRFVIGEDACVEGLHWAAGLGGHGMTAALAVGELVAADLLTGKLDATYRRAFRPERGSTAAVSEQPGRLQRSTSAR